MGTDSQIQADVMAQLKSEPLLTDNEIGVTAKHGIVTLSGTVDTLSKKVAAETSVKKIKGVKGVALDIEVIPSNSTKRNDSQIAEAVVNALKWSTKVPDEKISISVEEGWVTLNGTVDWEYQITAAYDAVKNMVGVRGVTNLIKVVPKVEPAEIKKKIEAAFERIAILEAQRIKVDTIGSKVFLNGTVRSWAEKEDAQIAAFAAPGVTEVQNDLLVESKVTVY